MTSNELNVFKYADSIRVSQNSSIDAPLSPTNANLAFEGQPDEYDYDLVERIFETEQDDNDFPEIFSNMHIPNLGPVDHIFQPLLSNTPLQENTSLPHPAKTVNSDDVDPTLIRSSVQEDSAIPNIEVTHTVENNLSPCFATGSPTPKHTQTNPSSLYLYRLGKDEKTLDFVLAYIKSMPGTTSTNPSGQRQCVYLTHYNSSCRRSFDTLPEAVEHVEKHLKNRRCISRRLAEFSKRKVNFLPATRETILQPECLCPVGLDDSRLRGPYAKEREEVAGGTKVVLMGGRVVGALEGNQGGVNAHGKRGMSIDSAGMTSRATSLVHVPERSATMPNPNPTITFGSTERAALLSVEKGGLSASGASAGATATAVTANMGPRGMAAWTQEECDTG
ncbi:hypothetical protein M422DRAFT_274240 [Sphaerobolus stellatus SS14]|uniref:Unplaced genomic scaffold SPHSTscaffold_375, whole genome shotgun sequence n=1 Tax=Sphaerobolus stellatus (strain SS14) TaxID=990650 RepID=A0A0C9UHK5_SPHS4|nr:hypothetical protein M422DRAFT_274240 [Sphaerobolus stellatus SS14]